MKIWLQVLVCGGVICLAGAGQRSGVYLTVESPRRDLTAAERGAERFPQGSRLWLVAGTGRQPLAAKFFAAADPQVSFDARRVLFAGRETSTSLWQVYEAELPSGQPHRITDGTADIIRPVYLPDAIAYARRTATGFQIERLKDGKAVRLTYAPGNWLPSDVLEDGRILLDGPHALGRDIYTLYSDGSGIETVRCDHAGTRRNAHQNTSGEILFEGKTGPGRFVSARAAALPATAYAPNRVPVNVRAIPRKHPTGLHDTDGANLLCLSVYTSKLSIADGAAAKVRVYSEHGAIGESPVESDGSFYLQVPSDKPLRFEVLDQAGATVAAQKSWMWVRRGEQRICVGCHAGPERAPENAVPKVLESNTKPVVISGGRP